MNDTILVEHARVDRLEKYYNTIERDKHGSKYGLRNRYYQCTKCKVAFGCYQPYYLARFKLKGLWYAVPRPLNIMPACPDCLSRDNVEVVNRYKKRDDKND